MVKHFYLVSSQLRLEPTTGVARQKKSKRECHASEFDENYVVVDIFLCIKLKSKTWA